MWNNIINSVKNNIRIKYGNELNEQQLKVVTNTKGYYLVLAGAGSGKTRTLVYRVAYLVEQEVDPSSILLLTFTKKAAQEMLDRANDLLDSRVFGISGGTFHAYAAQILRRYARHIGYKNNFTIQDRGDALSALKIVMEEKQLGKNKQFPNAKLFLGIVSKAINTGRAYEEVIIAENPQFEQQTEDIIALAERYQQYKREQNVMDFDDLLVYLLQILQDDNHREKIAIPIHYIMVDEYQDTNKLQVEIIRLLALSHGNLLVVGDDSQSIYSFRGADHQNIMEFPKNFPGTELIILEQNYRSTQPILSFSNTILKNASEKFDKRLFSEKTEGQKPIYIKAKSEDEQAWVICQAVEQLRVDGVKLSEIAVLFRASSHSNQLEIKLAGSGIPFVKYGGLKFTELSHVKDIMAILKISVNISDKISWLRALCLFDGLGTTTADIIYLTVLEKGYDALLSKKYSSKKYSQDLEDLNRVIAEVRGQREGVKLSQLMDFYRPYFEKKYDDHKKREKDFETLLNLAESHDSIQNFIDQIAVDPPDSQNDGENEQDCLALSTIHSAKGLEWHTVFIIHLVEGCFPCSYSLEDDGQMEEERRLLYVASTRTKKNLLIISPRLSRKGRDFSHYNSRITPSRFIIENAEFRQVTEEWEVQN